MKFQITPEQREKVNNWLKTEMYPKAIERQKSLLPDPTIEMCHRDGYPYEGAIGGGLTYKFTPTSVGVVIKAVYSGEELDLTDYEMF